MALTELAASLSYSSKADSHPLHLRAHKKGSSLSPPTVGCWGLVSPMSLLYQLAVATCRPLTLILKRSTFIHSCQDAHTKEIANTVVS